MKPTSDEIKSRFKLALNKTLGIGSLRDALIESKSDLKGKTATPIDQYYGSGKIVNIDVNTRTERFKVCLERGVGIGTWYQWVQLDEVTIND